MNEKDRHYAESATATMYIAQWYKDRDIMITLEKSFLADISSFQPQRYNRLACLSKGHDLSWSSNKNFDKKFYRAFHKQYLQFLLVQLLITDPLLKLLASCKLLCRSSKVNIAAIVQCYWDCRLFTIEWMICSNITTYKPQACNRHLLLNEVCGEIAENTPQICRKQ